MTRIQFIGNPARAKFAHQLWRTNLMFRAYRHDLSETIGQRLACLTSAAQKDVQAGRYDTSDVNRVQTEVLSRLPNPAGTDFSDISPGSWQSWFVVRRRALKGATISPIGEGCLEPCSFCMEGNATGWVKSDPLYVVAANVRHSYGGIQQKHGEVYYFQGLTRNNVPEWLDPFFGFDAGSLAASLARLDCIVVFAPIIKGFDPNDPRALNVARRIVQIMQPNYRNEIQLSFHLGMGIPDFDIIEEIYGAGGGKIPKEVIEKYAERYGEIFRILGPGIERVLLYGSSTDIRYGKITEFPLYDERDMNDMFNRATRQAFLSALSLAGIDACELPFILDRRPISNVGRGHDFFRRLNYAWLNKGRCMAVDHVCVRDNVEREAPHTRSKRNLAGDVVVISPQLQEETFPSLDELWPLVA